MSPTPPRTDTNWPDKVQILSCPHLVLNSKYSSPKLFNDMHVFHDATMFNYIGHIYIKQIHDILLILLSSIPSCPRLLTLELEDFSFSDRGV